MRIAVIGAGFTGSLLAVHLLRRALPDLKVSLIERRGRFGPGLAYSTDNPNHVLNVRASNMSAFADRPDDFVEWLRHTPFVDPATPAETTFVQRRTFGRYVGHCLARTLAVTPDERFELISDSVEDLAETPEGLVLTLERRGRLEADLAILATGHFPPAPPPLADPSLFASPLYRGDPWASDALADLDPDARVLLLGSGLTMVDLVVALLDAGHRGPIHAISRRGLAPQRHAPARPWHAFLPQPLPGGIVTLTRLIRQEVRTAAAAGVDWRSVIDALRPLTTPLWRGLDHEQRARFLRHVRAWWEVHRHRMAPAVADRIDEARRSGQFTLRAARLLGGEAAGDALRVELLPRGAQHSESLVVDRLVNCAGPSSDFRRIAAPLVRRLLERGAIRPDPLGLGLDVTDAGAVIAAGGQASSRVYAAGPITRGALWEITAVPDLRRQCEELAGHLARLAQPVAA